MIYCVVPASLSGELFDRLEAHYADEPHVEVIVDRRRSERRARNGRPPEDGQRETRDRRRARVPGDLPAV